MRCLPVAYLTFLLSLVRLSLVFAFTFVEKGA